MSWNPLSSENVAERAQFLSFAFKAGPPILFLLSALVFGLAAKEMIRPGMAVFLLVANVPITVLVVLGMWRLIGGAAEGLVQMVYGAGNLPPNPAHSAHESLVARGFYAEAVEAYRAHIEANPTDNLARLKLAAVLRDHRADAAAAEALFLEVRRSAPSPGEEMFVSNMLIEMYRVSGRQDRLIVELARFADRYRGTRPGAEAARLLKELKAEGARTVKGPPEQEP